VKTLQSYRKAKIKLTLNRLKNFLSIYARNKKGIVGVAILAFYTFIAFAAPLLTPYSPTDFTPLSGQMSAPAWLRNFPGGEMLSENVKPIKGSDFSTPETLNQWNFTITNASILTQHVQSMGNPYGSGAGAIAVKFVREEIGRTYGKINFTMYQEFYYPYKGPPQLFVGYIAISITGTGERKGTAIALDVPVKISVYLKRMGEGQAKWKLWPQPTITFDIPSPIINKTTGIVEIINPGWIISKQSPSANNTQIDPRDPAFAAIFPDSVKTIFNTTWLPCKYVYGVEIEFLDTNKEMENKKVETTVYIDDVTFQTYGTAFGLLGTDHIGRDIYTQLLYGARISLYVGLLSSFIGVVLGLLLGLASGYLGRIVDEIIMRFTDMLLVIPTLPLLIVLVEVLGTSLNNLILILGFLGWMGFARTVRSQVLSLRERSFVEAAIAIGAGRTHIIFRHILPNVMSLVYVSLATAVPGNVVAEAALSWLGFYDPAVMSWGRMLNDVQNNAGGGSLFMWWWILPPGLSIALIAIAFVMIGYALDEVLNPRLRMRR
jgi:ABC-type dipeptide/oligopeptide/nickel transport system permease subunit